MSSRKYANDYRLENVDSPSGKLRTVAVYTGADYVFTAQTGQLSRARLVLAVCSVVLWVLQLAAFSLKTRIAHCAWVVMPQAFILLTLGFLTVGVWMLFTAQPRMTREFAEKVENRVSGGAVMSLFLCSVTLAASIAAAIVFRSELVLPADIIYIVLLTLSEAVCVLAFSKRGCAHSERLSGEPDAGQQ